MSTRRTTRAGSRAASSVGGAHAVGPEDIPVARTPGRGRPRKSGSVAGSERSAGLPSMAPSTSTAYGTNTLALPNFGPRGAPLANDISSVIESLMDPEPPNKGTRFRQVQEPVPDVDAPDIQQNPNAPAHTPSMRSRSGPVKRRVPRPSVDRNFQNESQLFDNASIISNSYQQEDFLRFSGPSLDEGELNRRVALKNLMEQQQYMRGGAGDETILNFGDGTTISVRQVLGSPLRSFKKLTKSFFDIFGDLSKYLLPLLALGTIAFIAWIAYLNSGGPSIHWYGSDISATLGQFIPSQIKHPSRIFAPQDLKDVYRRLDIAESDITFLKHRSTIDQNALSEIKKILPEFIALEKDYQGKPTLPANLWQAMREKIRTDPSLIPTPIQSPSEGPTSSSSKSDTRNHEVFNSKEFDRYLESNRIKIQTWAGSEFDVLHQNRIQQLIKDGKIASRENVVELIKKNWRDSSQEVRSELQRITRELESRVANLGKQAITAEQVKELANEVIKAQIEAISKANVDKNVGQAIHRADHFARRGGAAVIPKLTTPSYSFPHMNVHFLHRTFAYLINHPIPLPNPASAALTPWEEIGDCWCSPQQNGNGPTLGVQTAYNIWPDQVVVEHFPQSGYANSGLSPLSAPKQMELLAHIPSKPTCLKVQAQSDAIFPEDKHDDALEPGWVKLGEWSYDAFGPTTQVFPIQIDLKDFITNPEDIKKDPSATSKFLIRSKGNHGHGTVPYTCLYRIRLHGDVKPDEEI